MITLPTLVPIHFPLKIQPSGFLIIPPPPPVSSHKNAKTNTMVLVMHYIKPRNLIIQCKHKCSSRDIVYTYKSNSIPTSISFSCCYNHLPLQYPGEGDPK